MKKFIKKIPPHILPVIFGGVIAVAGLVLIIAPANSLNIVCFAGGVAVLVKAAAKLVEYIISAKDNSARSSDLFSFAVTAGIGVVLMVHPQSLLAIFPIIVGIGTLIYGIICFFTKGRLSLWNKIVAAVIAIIGIIVINSPMFFAEAATAASGVAIFAVGVFIIASRFYAAKILKESDIETTDSDGYTEVDFTDVDE